MGVGLLRCDEFGELLGGKGPAEIETLRFIAFLIFQKCECLERFDAFGYHAQIKLFAHADDRAHDGRLITVRGDTTDKGLVNLEGVETKILKIAQAGVTGAEVIHCHLDPRFPQCLQGRCSAIGMFHERTFCQLDLERTGPQAGLANWAGL